MSPEGGHVASARADGDMEEGITTRSASNQTSLAFHPGKVGSEVGGKSFFAVTVYATAT